MTGAIFPADGYQYNPDSRSHSTITARPCHLGSLDVCQRSGQAIFPYGGVWYQCCFFCWWRIHGWKLLTPRRPTVVPTKPRSCLPRIAFVAPTSSVHMPVPWCTVVIIRWIVLVFSVSFAKPPFVNCPEILSAPSPKYFPTTKLWTHPRSLIFVQQHRALSFMLVETTSFFGFFGSQATHPPPRVLQGWLTILILVL